jgi:hypothetical protein
VKRSGEGRPTRDEGWAENESKNEKKESEGGNESENGNGKESEMNT